MEAAEGRVNCFLQVCEAPADRIVNLQLPAGTEVRGCTVACSPGATQLSGLHRVIPRGRLDGGLAGAGGVRDTPNGPDGPPMRQAGSVPSGPGPKGPRRGPGATRSITAGARGPLMLVALLTKGATLGVRHTQEAGRRDWPPAIATIAASFPFPGLLTDLRDGHFDRQIGTRLSEIQFVSEAFQFDALPAWPLSLRTRPVPSVPTAASDADPGAYRCADATGQ